MDYVDGLDAARLLASRFPEGIPTDQALRVVTAVGMVVGHAGTGPDGGLLMVDNGAMSSMDDVARLRVEGLSIRAIADELKLSKSAVHRMLAAADDLDVEDDLEERELALLDGNPGYEAVPPFEFVGIATVTGVARLGRPSSRRGSAVRGRQRVLRLAPRHLPGGLRGRVRGPRPDGRRAGSDRADGQRWYAEAEEQWRRVG
jgi:hypothetical protein